jgi:hypothetical protein
MNGFFVELSQLHSDANPGRMLDRLIEILRDSGNYHQLFDASLLQKKLAMGIEPVDPSGFDDVPEACRAEFEEYYIETARKVGQMLLEAGNIAAAWVYFRTIREPDPVVKAIEAYQPEPDGSPSDEIIELALYQGLAPAKGVELMLAYHGTCPTITALDQGFRQLAPEHRRACAGVMVRKLYRDLRGSVGLDLERRGGTLPAEAISLAEVVEQHPELFENDNYHIDVSHLNAVVRFARSLGPNDVELHEARQLTEYGRQLAPQYQYAAEPPFDQFYPASYHYFSVLMDDHRGESLNYFRDRLAADPGEQEPETHRQLIALALVELLSKIGEESEAAEIGVKYLAGIQDQIGISLGELCLKAKRPDLLADLARSRDDLVAFALAMLRLPQGSA